MKGITVSVAEGKKGFSRFIQEAVEKKERIIIPKRKKPVAVIVPYDDYQRSMRLEGYRKIMEVREAFSKAKIRASEIYRESKKQLEGRP